MKRKRQSRGAERATKRVKAHVDQSRVRPSNALLKAYYPEVVTLRQYLASRLPKKRRRRLQQYGRADGHEHHVELTRLLDAALVGTFQHVPIDDSSIVEEDLTLFTQQLSATDDGRTCTPGHLRQHEIVDFAIWLLFRRLPGIQRPQHLLCQNYQRYLTAHDDGVGPEIVPGIPGVYSNGSHQNVDCLKSHPWTVLPEFIGRGAERIMGDLLIDCGLFVPVSNSSNLIQLSGVPMSELKTFRYAEATTSAEVQLSGGHQKYPDANSVKESSLRPLSEIRFVRHRMLYAKGANDSSGGAPFGLAQTHVLNRYRDTKSEAETHHVMKYVFPAQFGLHNVLNSTVSRKETAHAFEDYTLRETEILRTCRSERRRTVEGDDNADSRPRALPKRLRGTAKALVGQLRNRHARCAYTALLDHYCPRSGFRPASGQALLEQACRPVQVSAFCRAAVFKVFPHDIWGNGHLGAHNRRVLHRNIDKFIRLRRFESMSLHDVLQEMKLLSIDWLVPHNLQQGANVSKSDMSKRTELMAELLYYLFDSYLIPLIRSHFHVTEPNAQRNQLFYFRHDVWVRMCEPSLTTLRQSMLEECNAAAVDKALAKRTIGVSHVRLVPKAAGMRPIINLRRRVQKMRHGQLVLGRSINSILTPAFSVLNYEKTLRPELLGSALFSVDEIFPRLQTYRQTLSSHGLVGQPLYFAKVDVQACFDTIPQKRLMDLVTGILRNDKYEISKYSRAKLLGGHNKETPGFGTKPSWKFLTKASGLQETFDFQKEAESEVAGGKTKSVYINGLAPKTESRDTLLSLLQEHIEANIIKIGKRYYRQKHGIAQGSIVSSLLCSFFYAELEHDVLGFVQEGNSVLLRLIDDFLVISTERSIAERFMHVMHGGLPEYGVKVKAEKSRANFDVQAGGSTITKITGPEFAYCGTMIHTATLDLSKDKERRRETNIADSVAVEYSRLPGQTFYRKTLNALKLQMHAMLLSTAYNSLDTVLSNLHHNFLEVAQKCLHYMKSLSPAKQPADKLVIRVLDDMIKLACILMKRRKRTSKDVMPYECSVSNVQARWLACKAFQAVFSRRQTKHGELLGWLQKQLGLPALRKQERRMSVVIERQER